MINNKIIGFRAQRYGFIYKRNHFLLYIVMNGSLFEFYSTFFVLCFHLFNYLCLWKIES